MIVIIDNYDSFTYNFVQTIAAYVVEELQTELKVFRNDEIDVDGIAKLKPMRKGTSVRVHVAPRHCGLLKTAEQN